MGISRACYAMGIFFSTMALLALILLTGLTIGIFEAGPAAGIGTIIALLYYGVILLGYIVLMLLGLASAAFGSRAVSGNWGWPPIIISAAWIVTSLTLLAYIASSPGAEKLVIVLLLLAPPLLLALLGLRVLRKGRRKAGLPATPGELEF